MIKAKFISPELSEGNCIFNQVYAWLRNESCLTFAHDLVPCAYVHFCMFWEIDCIVAVLLNQITSDKSTQTPNQS